MLLNGGECSTQIVALQTMALRDDPHDRPQPRIMGMRDVRKQMMFDLVVQAAGEPGGDAR